MSGLVIAFIFFVFVIVLALKLAERLLRGRFPGVLPYEQNGKLFSPAERSFLGVLEQIVGAEYRILGKIRLADIIRTRRGLSNSARTSAFNRICSRHVDFVLCDPRTFEIAGVIELDDSSHEKELRRVSDQFMDKALSAAGVPFVRFKAQRAYVPAEIREKVSQILSRKA